MIKPYPFFLLRRPAYSLGYLNQFYQQLPAQSLDAGLQTWYATALVQQAIYVASQPLYERCQRWLADEPLKSEKLVVTLHKYLIRMCTRCTPYGLFAGCAVGTIGEKTLLEPGTEPARQHTRPDIEALLSLKDYLVGFPHVRDQLRVYPNSTLYPVGDTLRYVEQQRENGQRQYFISSVGVDAHLRRIYLKLGVFDRISAAVRGITKVRGSAAARGAGATRRSPAGRESAAGRGSAAVRGAVSVAGDPGRTRIA